MSLTPTQEKRVKQENMERLNRSLDAPVPGESLTVPPKSSPMEYPPQYDTPEEVLESLFDAMLIPQVRAKFVNAMEEGAPAEAIAKTVLFGGAANGKWTPDTAIASLEPHTVQIAWLAEKSGVKGFHILDRLVEEGPSIKEGIETKEPPRDRLEGELEVEKKEEIPASDNMQEELGF